MYVAGTADEESTVLLPLLAFALTQAPQAPPVAVARADVPPIVDGALDDAAWTRATVVDHFIQRTPSDGTPSTQRTEVLLLYTPVTLFVGLRAYDDDPDQIVATVMRRDDDALLQNDQFAMAIDSYGDGRNGFWFSTNALGARVDYQFFDEGTQWIDWDGDWQASARRTGAGWTAELAIPFAALRFHADSVVVMGMNFFRRIIRTNEQTFSPHIPLEYAQGTATVSRARRFAFRGIAGNALGYVRPYGLAGVSREGLRTPAAPTQRDGALGVDARMNVTDNVTATLSYNTDFAQVEVDDRQLNLTRFSLFFPEKREFFLEDGGLFAFGAPQEAEVFFSRRIGLAAAPDSSGTLRRVPILFGGKVVARAGALELGALDVLTHPDLAAATNYGVVRLKAGVAPRSYVGAHVTTTHTSEAGEGTAGADANLYLHGVTGVRGFAVTRWGADLTAPQRAASAYDAELFHAGSRLDATLGLLEVGSAFQPAIGFITRAGTRRLTADVATPWYPEAGSVRRIEPRATLREYRVIGGGLQSRTASATLTVDLRTDDQIAAGVSESREVVAGAFQIFRDHVVQPGDYRATDGWVQLTTKPGRRLSAVVIGRYGGLLGGRRTEASATLTWKAGTRLTLSDAYHVAAVRGVAGRFTAQTVRSRADFALNTSFSVIGIAQYDNDTQQLGFNLRAVYQFREGTEIYVVLNHRGERPGLDGRLLGERRDDTVLVKVTYRLNVP